MQLHALPQRTLSVGGRCLDLSRPQVMGILNVTPDSFSDGGQHQQLDAALYSAEKMLREGATILDIGGESTRPNAQAVSLSEECGRVLPVVAAIAERFDVVLSIDTSTPSLFAQAAAITPCIWNDVRALTRLDALVTAARCGLPVILMHMRGEPSTMNDLAHYDQVVDNVLAELKMRVDAALAAGIAAHNIVLDVGFGFAKNTTHNLQLLRDLAQFHDLGLPLLVGISRKRVLGEVLGGAPVDQRVAAGVAAALLAVQQGACMVRTHDVKPTVDALTLWQAVLDI